MIQVQIWDEKFSLDTLFTMLSREGVTLPVLKAMFREYLIIKKVEEYNLKIPRSPEQDKQLLDDFRKQRQLHDNEAFKQFLAKGKLSPENLLAKLIKGEEIQRLKQTVITEEEVREAFLKVKPTLDRIVFQMMRIPKLALAQEIYYRLEDDQQDFARLAKQYSTGPEAKDGGLVGPIPISQMNPELRQVLMQLQPGQISEPFTVDQQVYLIVQILRLEEAQLSETMKTKLLNERFEHWLDRQFLLANIQVYDRDQRLDFTSPDETPELKEDRVL